MRVHSHPGVSWEEKTDEDGSALLLKFDADGVCVLETGTDQYLVLQRGDDGDLDVQVRTLDPEWLSHDAEPTVDQLKQDALNRHGFGPALAAGHHLRLHEPPSDQLAGLVQAALASGTGPRVAVTRSWLDSQRPTRVAAWQTSATGLAIRALDDLQLLEEDYSLEDPGWHRALQRLLVHRDDLASLQQVLGLGTDTTAVVDEALEALDGALRPFLDSLPVEPQLESEQLVLAALRDLDAWWAEPARPG